MLEDIDYQNFENTLINTVGKRLPRVRFFPMLYPKPEAIIQPDLQKFGCDETIYALKYDGDDIVLEKRQKGDRSKNLIRFLPYMENGCTGIILDKEAKFFMSGPFNGCTFYMHRTQQDRTVIMHSNDNAKTGSKHFYASQFYRRYCDNLIKKNQFYFEAQYDNWMKRTQGYILGARDPDNPIKWKLVYMVTEPLSFTFCCWQSYIKTWGMFELKK